MLKRTLLGHLPLHCGTVTVLTSLLLMPHVALGFERAQHRQYCGVCELIAQSLLHVADDGRSVVPEHLHDVRFAVCSADLHRALTPRSLVYNAKYKISATCAGWILVTHYGSTRTASKSRHSAVGNLAG